MNYFCENCSVETIVSSHLKYLLTLASLLLVAGFMRPALAQNAFYDVSGTVRDLSSGEPLAGAVVNIDELWSVTEADGRFTIARVSPGKCTLKVSLLGYVDVAMPLEVKGRTGGLEVKMQVSTLALKEVVVTAQRPAEGTGTTHNVGRDALNQLQLSNMTDMTALLPGGKTSNPDLTSSNSFSIRSAGAAAGNAAFSTAVEVDGVRLGNNAAFGQMSGVDTRGVAVDNVESVEVISGVPSAEYGDLGSGMVKIHTKRGRTPFNLAFTVNPRTWQTSVSKGVGLPGDGGVLNLSAEWARATKKLTSPYESYTRRGLGMTYSNTFAKVLRFEAGVNGNLGGMDSKDDPDAFVGEYSKARANSLRANTSFTWLLNRSWITNLKADAFVSYADNLSHNHKYNSSASRLPAVHSEKEGYSYADLLPEGKYFSDQMTDSRELDYGASLKYSLINRWSGYKSSLKAGLQWKANGNVGEGEYYQDPSLAADGYRPRPYRDYPFMHSISPYIEEDFNFPFGLQITAGLRMDNVIVKGSAYNNVSSLSPRFNAKWQIIDNLALRAGWGVAEKLPSFYILYPRQEYRDILVGSGYDEAGQLYYRYYTKPYKIEYNPDLKWQRNENAEIGIDAKFLGTSISLVGFSNITRNPYDFTNNYSVVELERDGVTDRTFVATRRQDNGAPVYRAGAELTADFPEIRPLRTSLRLDASFNWSKTDDAGLYYYYNNGWSHSSIAGRSYQYVGVYANGGNSNLMIRGKMTRSLDANLTAITHIPEARLVITCRIEASIFSRSMNIPTGGEDALYPVAYLDVEDEVPEMHPFTEEMKRDPKFRDLVIKPSNNYLFDLDGYGAYASANLNVTKEIGDHFSLSFFANNFTNSRPYVVSLATGVGAIFTPAFYYGLTCRIKL